jgi:hypothetical protein
MPARRPGGKAAKRKARQRNVPRQQTSPAPSAPSPAPTAAVEPEAIPPVGTPDAREAVSLDPPRRRSSSVVSSAGSTLTARERADYHYVERDLRNIGILTAAMAVLLFLAWLAFTALGIVG